MKKWLTAALFGLMIGCGSITEQRVPNLPCSWLGQAPAIISNDCSAEMTLKAGEAQYVYFKQFTAPKTSVYIGAEIRPFCTQGTVVLALLDSTATAIGKIEYPFAPDFAYLELKAIDFQTQAIIGAISPIDCKIVLRLFDHTTSHN